MNKKYTTSVQNRFSAYLVAALAHQRNRYLDRKKELLQRETALEEREIKTLINFDAIYQTMPDVQVGAFSTAWEELYDFVLAMEGDRLVKALAKLKDREHKLLFARVFGELTFEELGRMLGIKPKQAEMSYYYILRKLRKELEVKR